MCGEDIFDRNAKFVRVEIDESYPLYLREHQEEYDFLMAPKVGKAGIFVKRTRLAGRQALRRLHGMIAKVLHGRK